jgi:hypothetical protein
MADIGLESGKFRPISDGGTLRQALNLSLDTGTKTPAFSTVTLTTTDPSRCRRRYRRWHRLGFPATGRPFGALIGLISLEK